MKNGMGFTIVSWFRLAILATGFILQFSCSGESSKPPETAGEFFYSVYDGKSWGVINRNGEYVSGPCFSSVPSPPLAGKFFAEKDGEFSHYKTDGSRMPGSPCYDAGPFSGGLAAVVPKGKTNPVFVNEAGDIVLDENYEALAVFSEGLSAFRIDGLWGFVNVSGDLAIEQNWDSLPGPFVNGLAAVREKRQVGYIDTSGEYVIRPRFREGGPFVGGLAVVKSGKYYGYINREGEWEIDARFDKAMPFFHDLAAVREEGNWGFINRSGEFVIDPEFREAENFSEGMAMARSEKGCGYINISGEYVIVPQFEAAGSFYSGLAPVKSGGKWGFINTEGKFEIQPRFDSVNLVSPYTMAELADAGKRAVTVSLKPAVVARAFLESLYDGDFHAASSFATPSTKEILDQVSGNGYDFKWPSSIEITRQNPLSDKKIQVHYKTTDSAGMTRDNTLTVVRVHGEWKVAMNLEELSDDAVL